MPLKYKVGDWVWLRTNKADLTGGSICFRHADKEWKKRAYPDLEKFEIIAIDPEIVNDVRESYMIDLGERHKYWHDKTFPSELVRFKIKQKNLHLLSIFESGIIVGKRKCPLC